MFTRAVPPRAASGTAGCPYLQGWGRLRRGHSSDGGPAFLPSSETSSCGKQSMVPACSLRGVEPGCAFPRPRVRGPHATLSLGPAPPRLDPCSTSFDTDDETTIPGHRRVAPPPCPLARAPLWLRPPPASGPGRPFPGWSSPFPPPSVSAQMSSMGGAF